MTGNGVSFVVSTGQGNDQRLRHPHGGFFDCAGDGGIPGKEFSNGQIPMGSMESMEVELGKGSHELVDLPPSLMKGHQNPKIK